MTASSSRISTRLWRATAFAALATVLLLAPAAPALARPDFNPRLVLSDARMREANSMSPAQVQAFLRARPGLLKGMSFSRESNGAVEPAYMIIWESAQAWRVSPKVLLTMLQKEQSLLTRTTLAPHTLERAVGAGCPDSGGNRYPGFGNQLWNCGRLLDGYGEPGKTTDYVPHPWTPGLANSFTAGVHTDSLATYKLYVYNPSIGAHTPYGDLSNQSCSGNANFWKIYWTYFGNPLYVPPSTATSASLPATAAITLRGQSVRHPWNRSVIITGTLTSSDATDAPVSGKSVLLEKWTGVGWAPLASTEQTVSDTGAFAIPVSSATLSRVRVAFDGSPALRSTRSGLYVLDAAATITTPTCSPHPLSTSNATIRGVLGPAHAAPVSLALWHRLSGVWVYSRTVRFGSARTGAWAVSLRLSRGTWRFRASHNDAGHALGQSGWGYASVR